MDYEVVKRVLEISMCARLAIDALGVRLVVTEQPKRQWINVAVEPAELLMNGLDGAVADSFEPGTSLAIGP